MLYLCTQKSINNLKRKDKIMSTKNYKFETLQLHVGQEQADPATDARSITLSTQPTASVSAMQVISMVV